VAGSVPLDEVESYLVERAWLTDAARILDRARADLATEPVDTADHAPVDPVSLRVPFPRRW
jgi:hypothetical protein